MSGSHTVGTITLSGFTSESTATPFAPLTDSAPDNNYVFNWSGPDVDGNGSGQIVAAAGTGAWSLTVRLLAFPGHANFGSEQLLSGLTVLADFGDTAGYTATGTGATQLQAFIQSLNVNFSSSTAAQSDAYRISFSLDVGGDVASWDTYFQATSLPCFAEGTRLAVPAGEIRVEDLRIGDHVLTASAAVRPVKWIGRRAYTAAQRATNPHLRPVLIRRDALAPGRPRRDLRLSPLHALLLDGVLVPAAALVNGVSILRDDRPGPLTYLHIELATHDAILAEGLPAETFVDDSSRQMFDNADEYYALYGAETGAGFAANRIEEGFQLEAIRRRIAARAGAALAAAVAGELRGHVERLEDGVLHGWVIDSANPSVPVELEVLVEGEVIARAIANRYRVDLDFHGIAGGRGGFTVAMPAAVESLAQVSVRRAADGAPVAKPAVAETAAG